MPIAFLQAISPTSLLLSVIVPVIFGFGGRRLRRSVILGWSLFIVSFLFQDILTPVLANHFHGPEVAKTVAIDQPGTVATVFGGWVLPLVGHFVGRGFKRLRNLVTSRAARQN